MISNTKISSQNVCSAIQYTDCCNVLITLDGRQRLFKLEARFFGIEPTIIETMEVADLQSESLNPHASHISPLIFVQFYSH